MMQKRERGVRKSLYRQIASEDTSENAAHQSHSTHADALIHTHNMTKHPNTPEREYTHLTDTKTMMKHPNTLERGRHLICQQ